MQLTRLFLLAALLGPALACAEEAARPEPGGRKPQVIAMVAAIGDQLDYVRQKASVGSLIEPFTRKRIDVNGQMLNFAALKGLNRAIAEEEPQSQRVLLKWTTPAETAQRLKDASGREREAIVLEALLRYLQALPERAQWDRIEAILPTYSFAELRGMGRRLSGIGIYVQPLKSALVDFNEEGEMTISDTDGENRTVNPSTGATAKSSTFVAPYMYFERLTLDARTLAVLGRKRLFDNIKYADPEAAALDVSQQFPWQKMIGKLIELVERSAYQSVHEEKSEVTVGLPRPVAGPAASAAR